MLKKDYLILIVLTFIFTVILFLLRIYLLNDFTENKDESFIDRSLFLDLEQDNLKKELVFPEQKNNSTGVTELNLINNISTNTGEKLTKIQENIQEKQINNLEKIDNSNFYFLYYPESFKQDISLKTIFFKKIILSDIFYSKILDFGIELHKEMLDVRGKMKNARVKLFGVLTLSDKEIVSVFIHEFGHYIDIYYLTENDFSDIDVSKNFYDISWESTKVIKQGIESKDFVSGYSMTNKYEDFAESFAYYVMHNSSFRKKAEKSGILKNKYNYFGDFLFKNQEFIDTDFSEKSEIKDYYRDITKIEINYKNFLQYFKKSI